MIKTTVAAAAIATLALAGTAQAQSSRDYIYIVGSSTVYPFATVVAEQFGKTTAYKTPKMESTGSGGGLKLFCAGVGVEHPDITNASRRIKQSEVDTCASNGVNEIIEVKIGYDGIVLANNKSQEQMDISLRELWLALAQKVPNPEGGDELVDNPYNRWSEINGDLPDYEISVMGPPPTSGTRDAFVELAMEGGCKTFDFIKAMDDDMFESVCHTLREDGAFVEAGENDNLIVQKLEANPRAFGVFGFSFLDQNRNIIQGALISATAPTFENIGSGAYPVSRALFFYVKKAHVDVIPGIREYLAEFTSPRAWGPDGYLADRGLIPMDEAEREKFAAAVENLRPLNLASN